MAASQTLRTLKLSLLADVSDFGAGMGKAGSDFQKFSRSVESASRVATGVIGAIGAIGVSAMSRRRAIIRHTYQPPQADRFNQQPTDQSTGPPTKPIPNPLR